MVLFRSYGSFFSFRGSRRVVIYSAGSVVVSGAADITREKVRKKKNLDFVAEEASATMGKKNIGRNTIIKLPSNHSGKKYPVLQLT